MSSPDTSVLRRAIDIYYAKQRRSKAMKWMLFNSVILTILIYDLSYKCAGYTSWLHYVEMCFAACLSASIASHGCQLIPSNTTPRMVSPKQMKLLGLKKEDLDSSLQLSSLCSSDSEIEDGASWDSFQNLSVSSGFSPKPEIPYTPSAVSTPRLPRSPRDEFIADQNQLDDYLRGRSNSIEELRRNAPNASTQWRTYTVLPTTTDVHQLSTVNTDKSASEENGEATADHVWRRLHIDPTQLTQFNLNLRRWLHETVLVRVVKEIETVDELLARGGHESRVGEIAPARLKAMCTAGPTCRPLLAYRLRELLPFLSDHPDQRYYVSRIRDLARGGTLSGYRWDGGADDWKPPRPTDAEIFHELFEAYVSTMSASVGSGAGVSVDTPRIVRTAPDHPPHYVLRLEKGTLDVGRGRNNLFHTILVFIAVASRFNPPAMCRLNVGPVGLNMSWIIGR